MLFVVKTIRDNFLWFNISVGPLLRSILKRCLLQSSKWNLLIYIFLWKIYSTKMKYIYICLIRKRAKQAIYCFHCYLRNSRTYGSTQAVKHRIVWSIGTSNQTVYSQEIGLKLEKEWWRIRRIKSTHAIYRYWILKISYAHYIIHIN